MRKLLAIDPGWATGVSRWTIPDDGPIEREAYWLLKNGPDGFDQFWVDFSEWTDIVVCESYLSDGRAPVPDPNALHIEGYLMGVWGRDEVVWQRNAAKVTVGDKLLKQHGFWLTGKQVGWKDARDVNDSQLHALSWAMSNHRPSQSYFWPKGK
jgi:hypothetical protein